MNQLIIQLIKHASKQATRQQNTQQSTYYQQPTNKSHKHTNRNKDGVTDSPQLRTRNSVKITKTHADLGKKIRAETDWREASYLRIVNAMIPISNHTAA